MYNYYKNMKCIDCEYLIDTNNININENDVTVY